MNLMHDDKISQIISFEHFSRNKLNIGCNLAENEVERGGGRGGGASVTAGTVFYKITGFMINELKSFSVLKRSLK